MPGPRGTDPKIIDAMRRAVEGLAERATSSAPKRGSRPSMKQIEGARARASAAEAINKTRAEQARQGRPKPSRVGKLRAKASARSGGTGRLKRFFLGNRPGGAKPAGKPGVIRRTGGWLGEKLVRSRGGPVSNLTVRGAGYAGVAATLALAAKTGYDARKALKERDELGSKLGLRVERPGYRPIADTAKMIFGDWSEGPTHIKFRPIIAASDPRKMKVTAPGEEAPEKKRKK